MNYVVRDKSTLNQLQRDKTLKQQFRAIRIELGAAPDEARSYERRINRYYFACGCTMGEIAVLSTLLAFGILWLIDRNSDLLVWWKIVGCIFGAALLGKIVGLVASHYLLRRTCAQLEKLLV